MVKLIIVMAASASGKSTYVDRAPSVDTTFALTGSVEYEVTLQNHATDKSYLLDGDDLIRALIGWPSLEGWYLHEDRKYFDVIGVASIYIMAGRLLMNSKECIFVFWNGEISYLKLVEEFWRDRLEQELDVTVALVEIDEALHREYVDARIAENKLNPRVNAYPKKWQEAHNNRMHLRSIMEKDLATDEPSFHATLFTTFDEVVSHFEGYAKADEDDHTEVEAD